jgi:molybdenum cofactor biosynthesis enzyme MoaA
MYTFTRLNEQIKINKVSFTGGEPTLKINELNRLLKEVKTVNPDVFTIVNTNGFAFKEINPEFIDSIALSRHHFLEYNNKFIFGTDNIATINDIESYAHKEKLHLSCNLIKGQIDSTEKCQTYINVFGDLGVTDIGFVSLMEVNDHAKEHFIDFDSIKLENMKDTIKNQHWTKKCGDKPMCKCANYLTSVANGNIVKSYARYYADRTECKGMLVYEVDGRLTAGFNGKVINE